MDSEIIKRLLRDYIKHLDGFYKDLGVFGVAQDRQDVAREICNRFYSNLVSLENHLCLKDSLSAALIQRYNHELAVDFYYLLDPSDREEKIRRFFGYSNDSNSREWSTLPLKEKRTSVPSSVASGNDLSSLYKTLSNMAHSNIVSIRLNRLGKDFEFNIIKGAIMLCIIEISNCIDYKVFRDLFPNVDWVTVLEKNRMFQSRITILLLTRDF